MPDHLDPFQEAAVGSRATATLVVAGPGSGKTRMLAERFRRRAAAACSPARVLALTFSKGAAREMAERLSDVDGARGSVSTFHSFFLSVVASHPARFGRAPALLSDQERRDIVASDPALGAGAEDLLARADAAREGEGRVGDPAVARYRELLHAAGRVDFAELLPLVLDACIGDEAFGAALAGRFTDVLVDEYQDVSPAQDAFLRFLQGAGLALWAVGDDDQTLYSHRSADVRHVTQFASRYPGADTFMVPTNYRSPPQVAKGADDMIRRNLKRVAKPHARPGSGDAVVVRCFADADAEAKAVGGAVQRLIARGAAPASIAVLARTNAAMHQVSRYVCRDDVAVETIHRAKGREWDHVFLGAFEDGLLPLDAAGSIEEERRIAFVAMTRARRALAITFAAERLGRASYVSRFLLETGFRGSSAAENPLLMLGSDGMVALWPVRPSPSLAPHRGPRQEKRCDPDIQATNAVNGNPMRSGTLWNATDDASLRGMVEAHLGVEEMGAALRRSVREVINRVSQLGMVAGQDVGRILADRHERCQRTGAV